MRWLSASCVALVLTVTGLARAEPGAADLKNPFARSPELPPILPPERAPLVDGAGVTPHATDLHDPFAARAARAPARDPDLRDPFTARPASQREPAARAADLPDPFTSRPAARAPAGARGPATDGPTDPFATRAATRRAPRPAGELQPLAPQGRPPAARSPRDPPADEPIDGLKNPFRRAAIAGAPARPNGEPTASELKDPFARRAPTRPARPPPPIQRPRRAR